MKIKLYNKAFETLPRIMKSLYFSRDFQYDWLTNSEVIETIPPTEKKLITKTVFSDTMALGGLYTHLALELFALFLRADPSIISEEVVYPTNATEESDPLFWQLTIARDKITSIMSPYLNHHPLSCTNTYTPIALCTKLSNIRLFVLKENAPDKKLYDVLYPIIITPSNLKNYQGCVNQRYGAFDVTMNFKVLNDYAKYKAPNVPNKSFIKIPRLLYQELSKLCDNATMLEDLYNLLVCSIAINTHNRDRIVCSKAKFMSVLPSRWIYCRKAKPMEFNCAGSEIKKKLSTLADLTKFLKSNLNTDIKLISKVDFPETRSKSEFIMYYE